MQRDFVHLELFTRREISQCLDSPAVNVPVKFQDATVDNCDTGIYGTNVYQ